MEDKLSGEDDLTVQSKSVPSSPIPIPHPNFRALHYKKQDGLNEDGEGLSFLSATSPLATSSHSLGRPIYAFLPGGDDEVDWAGHSETSLADHDSGLYSSSSHRSTSIPKSSSFNSFHDEEQDFSSTLEEGERSNSAAIVASGSEIELNDLYRRLKRRSQSYESLLSAYTEDDSGLKSVLHSTLTELARLSANLDGDSVLSDNDLGENDTSSINLDISFSEVCSETSLQQSSFDVSASSSRVMQELQASIDDSQSGTTTEKEVQSSPKREQCQEESGEKDDDSTPTGDCKNAGKPRPLLRAQSEFTCLEDKLRQSEREGRETSPPDDTAEEKENEGGKREKRKKRRSIHRSLSYNNSGITKAMLRRRRRKKSSTIADEDQSDGEKSKEPPSPSETLNLFKKASLGCAVGVESRSPLRNVICDTQPNTERDNYKLSVDREQ